jgi:hypothetical protein
LFVYDPATYRTFDAERNVELMRISAIRDREFYQLSSPEFSIKFSAYVNVDRIPSQVSQEIDKHENRYITTWHIIGVLPEFKNIVSEAMLAMEYGKKDYAKLHAVSEEVKKSFEGGIVRINF